MGCPHPGRTPPPRPGSALPRGHPAQILPGQAGASLTRLGPSWHWPRSSWKLLREPARAQSPRQHRGGAPGAATPPPLPGAALAAASPKRGWGGASSSRGGVWVLHVGTPSTAQPGAPRGAGCTSVPHRPDTRVRGSGSIHRGWGRAPRDAGYKKPPATCPQRWARPARPGGLMSDRVATQHRASTEPAPSQHPATCPLPGLSRVPTGSTAAPRESPGAARRGEQPGEPSASLGFACW